MAATQTVIKNSTETYEKVQTTFVYKNLGVITNNDVRSSSLSPKQITNLSTRPTTPISYDVPNRVLNLAKQSITGEYLQRNLDMSGRGFNAAMVGGCSVDNATVSNNALWSSERIMSQLETEITAFSQGLSGDRYVYVADMENIFFLVNHNLDSISLDYTLMVLQPDGTWKNDLCEVTVVDNNNLTVELSEPSKIRMAIHAVALTCSNGSTQVTGAFDSFRQMLLDRYLLKVGPEDPTPHTNPVQRYTYFFNETTSELFVCTDNTTDHNVWVGVLGTVGNIIEGR